MRIRYWPTREPLQTWPTFDFKPYPSNVGWLDRTNEITDTAEAYWGRHRKERAAHTIIVRAANTVFNDIVLGPDWPDDPTGGTITEASIIAHIQGGCSGWSRLKPYFETVCEHLYNAGYYPDAILLDLERPLLGRRTSYNGIGMWTLIPDMINNGQMPSDAPYLDAGLMGYTGNPWLTPPGDVHQNDVIMQANAWHEYIFNKAADRMTEVFHDTAVSWFGDDTWTANFGFQNQSSARMLYSNVNLESYYASSTIGGYSSPVLYFHEDYYPDASHALAALDTVPGDITKIKPWFIIPEDEDATPPVEDFHTGWPNLATPENTATLLAGLEARGITDCIGW